MCGDTLRQILHMLQGRYLMSVINLALLFIMFHVSRLNEKRCSRCTTCHVVTGGWQIYLAGYYGSFCIRLPV